VMNWHLILEMLSDPNHIIVDFFWNTIYELTVAVISYKVIVKKLEKRFKNNDRQN
jgi:hypothetical protein